MPRGLTDRVDDAREDYLLAIERGDRRAAVDIVLGLLDDGLPAERIIADVLVRSQAEVGRGWQEGRWTVAMEHRASAISESALRALADVAARAPGAVAEGSRGAAVVACTEGEWHILPGLMAAEVLRLRGAAVSFIGPSVPADDLVGMLGDDPPPAVAVTCSMPQSLGGAWRTISAMRSLGMTVLCGGRGFGHDGSWARALGADLWAPDYTSGADLLFQALAGDRPAPRGPALPDDVADEVRLLRRDHQEIVERGMVLAFQRWPFLRDSDRAIEATREDLGSTLRTVEAATAVASVGLLTGYIGWFESVLAARDLPLAFVSTGFDLLLEVLPDTLPLARDMATAGLAACAQPPTLDPPG